MTAALVQFIRARLDEDEQTARACPGDGTWTVEALEFYGRDLSNEVRTHAARHDPVRVLREIAAKRLMLDEALASRHLVTGDQFMDCPLVTEADGADTDHVERIQALSDMYREELGREPSCIETCGRDARVHRTLELLALPFVDHPEYMQAVLADQA